MNAYRHAILGFAVAIAMFGTASITRAFPEKPIEYIIPFAPGGESDITARLQQPFFKDKFGQDLVISYRPGRGGAGGWTELNDLPADGYTIMGVNLPHIVVQPARGGAGYETNKIETVYWFHYTPDAIVVTDDSPFKSLEDLIQYAKDNPGKLTFSGSGKGTANHLAQLRFDKMAGISTNYIALKGTGASNTALLVGEVEASWGYTTSAAAIGQQARILAIAMEQRHPKYPDTPTFKELGFDFVSGAYRGIAVPQGTPDAIKKKLSDMIAQINADPEFQQRMSDGGFAIVDVPFEQNAEFMEEKAKEFVEEAQDAGIVSR